MCQRRKFHCGWRAESKGTACFLRLYHTCYIYSYIISFSFNNNLWDSHLSFPLSQAKKLGHGKFSKFAQGHRISKWWDLNLNKLTPKLVFLICLLYCARGRKSKVWSRLVREIVLHLSHLLTLELSTISSM